MQKLECCPKCGGQVRRTRIGWTCNGEKCNVSNIKYVREGTLLEPIMRQVITYVTVM